MKILTSRINMDRLMVFNHYRFFISFNIPSHLTCMGIPLILDVVIYY